jgi:hypothetical protein
MCIGEMISSTNGAEKMGYPLQKIETKSKFLTYTNNNSKWIKNLNIRFETEIIPGIKQNTLDHKGNHFMNRTPTAQQFKV